MGNDLGREFFGKNGGRLDGDGTGKDNAGFTGPRWERQHQTKLANCAFTYGLKQKLEEHGIGNVNVLLADPQNIRVNCEGCEAAVGVFAF